MLPFSPHLLNNLSGTLIFFASMVTIVGFWPKTKIRQKLYCLLSLLSLIQLPIGFAVLIYFKHVSALQFNKPLNKPQWLEYSFAALAGSIFLFCLPVILLGTMKYYNSKPDLFIKFTLRSVLAWITVWVTFPLYQLYALLLLSTIGMFVLDGNILVCYIWMMSLRWDDTGLSSLAVLALTSLAISVKLMLPIIEQSAIRLRKFYTRCKKRSITQKKTGMIHKPKSSQVVPLNVI